MTKDEHQGLRDKRRGKKSKKWQSCRAVTGHALRSQVCTHIAWPSGIDQSCLGRHKKLSSLHREGKREPIKMIPAQLYCILKTL